MEPPTTGELQATETLPYGANFYDQGVFRTALKSFIDLGLDPKVLGNILTTFSREWSLSEKSAEVNATLIQNGIEEIFSIGRLTSDRYIRRLVKAARRSTVVPILLGLIRTPLLIQYVALTRDDTLYLHDGSPRPEAKMVGYNSGAAKTYENWYQKQSKAAKVGITHGIADVFPKTTPQGIADDSGKGSFQRMRTTINASGLGQKNGK